jgi:hypothetical protein
MEKVDRQVPRKELATVRVSRELNIEQGGRCVGEAGLMSEKNF